MRHIFYDSLKRFFVACALTVVGIFSATAANLPSGYTELEYIKSTGTQVIDSGTLIKRTSKIVLDAEITHVVNANVVLAGNAASSWSAQAVVRFEASNVLRISANTAGTASTYDTERHTYTLDINNGTGSKDGVVFNTFSNTGFSSTDNWQIFGVWWKDKYDFMTPAKLYSVKIYDGDTLVRNMVPAKQGNIVGMYDLVSGQFFTNQGTGTFTAGPEVLNPCRNLFDANSVLNVHRTCAVAGTFPAAGTAENGRTYFMQVEPNTTYTVSMTTAGDRLYIFGINSVVNPDDYTSDSRLAFDRTIFGATTDIPRQKTFTTNANERMVAIYYALHTIPTYFQIEQGSTETDYVPYCASNSAIKIATTKYTEDAFAGLMTTLSEAITKVTNIVDTTVQQATEIGNLATTKQDRPDTDCPAGRKCLLIMGADNKPHWYLIQE